MSIDSLWSRFSSQIPKRLCAFTTPTRPKMSSGRHSKDWSGLSLFRLTSKSF